MLLRLGTAISCSDGAVGELADFVIMPGNQRVTHLVVAPHNRHDQARLVPIELAAAGAGGDDVRLGCTIADVHDLPEVQEYAYVRIDEDPPLDDDGAVGIHEVITTPAPDYGTFETIPLEYDANVSVIYDRIPRGEVEVQRGSEVRDAGGARIGRLDGLGVGEDGAITQVMLERGHLWGRRRLIIPAGAVAHFDMDGVTLSISKSEVDRYVQR